MLMASNSIVIKHSVYRLHPGTARALNEIVTDYGDEVVRPSSGARNIDVYCDAQLDMKQRFTNTCRTRYI